ncbi:MAG: non-ribosomal peptide synthetase [Deltaproteobacteria bacterium]|nr:non-ribosomal peptide synthetase [Deltaproteobacteria bacterium]MBI2179300.1 non-ribosomal peptide synthetase [Deltaproteobacteria bacterium]MBI2227920.1 non-ribosomal peptide synthetase [Deltaproteobacteria bacterium]MBI2365721.1 non-ribosomal peptide synthetase [Deltaproteobacteria bacterium]
MKLFLKDSAARSNQRSPEAFVEFPVAECQQPIHHRFERQAILYADAPAVRLLSGDITYAELNAAANQAARMLLTKVGADSRPIALMLNQSYESVLWPLAILKAGLCYAPLDQRLPEHVLHAMVENLGPGALIAGTRYQDASRNIAANRFPVIDDYASRDGFLSENLDRPVTADSVAYVFYTSGSTGMAKGVADCHRNILHNILRYTNTLKFSRGDVLSLVQNPSFSGTVSSHFGALLNGAAIAPFDLQGEGLEALSQWLRRARITVFHGVPSIFRQLSDAVGRFPHIRLIRLEGDSVSAPDLRYFRTNFQDHCVLVNGLGATECGLVRQFFIDKNSNLDSTEAVPVGYPVQDMVVRIVDDYGRVLPSRSIGEIVVESRFLATGYWRNPVGTAERFEALDADLRRYRTGDLGRMGEDGCLTHLGRVDRCIRIAGEFVDTVAIERLLLDIPGISQGVVRDFVDHLGERRLCAYVVADAEAGVTVNRLREALCERIARHIVPTAFVFLDALPLTKDLKVDYQSLPQPGQQRPSLPNDYVAPQTVLEQRVARIWSEVLEIDPVGVTDSFFDLGGDSLRAARIVSRVVKQFQLQIPLKFLFQSPTIAAMAAVIAENPLNQPGAKQLESILDELESVSNEEAQRRLNEVTSTFAKK